MREQLQSVLSKLAHRLGGSNVVPAASNNTDLQKVFEEISTVINRKQSGITNFIDRVSHRAALSLTRHVKPEAYMTITYGFLVVIALSLIIIGSFASVTSIPYTALPPTKIHPLFDPSDFDLEHDCHIVYANDKEQHKRHDLMEEKHAIILPLTSAITLVGLYLIITKLHINWMKQILQLLNKNLQVMSIPIGTFVYTYFFHSIARYISYYGSLNPLKLLPRYRLTLTDDNEDINSTSGIVTNLHYRDVLSGKLYHESTLESIAKDSWEKHLYKRELKRPNAIASDKQLFNMYFNNATVTSALISCGLSALFYYRPQNWLITNLVTMNFAIWAISHMTLKNLRSGTLILAVLFFYDIFFVFKTDIMLTVATSLDLPIKLTIPTKFDIRENKFQFALLGLGDVVLPGMFISTCYKFDIWKWHLDHNDTEFHLLRWGYVGKYFITACVSYLLSLATCMVALTKYNTAQPALLYIVPYLLVSTILVALVSGEFKQFWTFQYDTIELGDNILEESENNDIITYSEYMNYNDNDEDEDEDDLEDYTEEDALLDDKADYEEYYKDEYGEISEENTIILDDNE